MLDQRDRGSASVPQTEDYQVIRRAPMMGGEQGRGKGEGVGAVGLKP